MVSVFFCVKEHAVRPFWFFCVGNMICIEGRWGVKVKVLKVDLNVISNRDRWEVPGPGFYQDREAGMYPGSWPGPELFYFRLDFYCNLDFKFRLNFNNILKETILKIYKVSTVQRTQSNMQNLIRDTSEKKAYSRNTLSCRNELSFIAIFAPLSCPDLMLYKRTTWRRGSLS